MRSTTSVDALSTQPADADRTLFRVLAAISFCHLLNDMLQSLLPSIYPILKTSFQLSFSQIGIVAFTYQVTASLLQPLIGYYTDKSPKPFFLPLGMLSTLAGLIVLAFTTDFRMLLIAAAFIGMGSSVFHPESSRVARLASGGRHGFAQSFFQVGGNTGAAIGPLLAALIILPRGQLGVLWFCAAALLACAVLYRLALWCKTQHVDRRATRSASVHSVAAPPRRQVITAMVVLILLVFSKYFYLASITNYYTFYLINRFGVSVGNSQLHLFVFLGAVADGTLLGGQLGDRYGRKQVIWGSILGVLPFTLMLPYADLFWTAVLSFIIGFILSSAFSAILVYAQELIPGRVGLISGLFFGLAFGMGGIGAAILGKLADIHGIVAVYRVCAWLPAIGLLTVFLPGTKCLNASKP